MIFIVVTSFLRDKTNVLLALEENNRSKTKRIKEGAKNRERRLNIGKIITILVSDNQMVSSCSTERSLIYFFLIYIFLGHMQNHQI